MKTKIITILFILIIILTKMQITYAGVTGTVYVESNVDTIEKGEDVEITINIKDVKTAAYNFTLYFDESKLDYISNAENTNVIENRIIFVWHDTTGGKQTREGELIKFKFKAKEDGIANFSVQGEFYNESGQEIKTSFKEKQIQIGKEESTLQMQEEKGDNTELSNANLKTLRLDIEGIEPQFKQATYEYYLTVSNDVKEIDVLAVSSNPNANVEVSGNTGLNQGLNTITVTVTSEDKTQKKEYKIQVTKTANIELANTNLETLAIEGTLLNPPFDNIETNYKTEVSNEIENLNILAIPENEKAKVQISGSNNLKVGNNIVTINVTASNGITTKKYQIEVYKRSEEQEDEYNSQQEEMQNKLEEAYEIEKLGVDQNSNENVAEPQKSNIVLLVVLSVVIIAIGTSYWYYRRKKN